MTHRRTSQRDGISGCKLTVIKVKLSESSNPIETNKEINPLSVDANKR